MHGRDWAVKRRTFITLLGGAAAWPLVAPAQQLSKSPTIGFLGTGAALFWTPWTTAFVQQLRNLGWVEGRNVALEYRWAEGRRERFADFAAEFVRLKVDVIVTSGSAMPTVMQSTSIIPIVFAIDPDPVGNGLVASLARPGGNVTGLSLQAPDLAGKRLELMREVVPGFRRLATLRTVGWAEEEMRELRAAVRALDLDLVDTLEIGRADDLVGAFGALKGGAQVLYVMTDALTNAIRHRINLLAAAAHLPTIYPAREFVEAGGLMSYGASYPDMFRRAAEYVDKILRGAKPGDIPVQQPTKFDLVLNLTTAKALGLTIPESFLLRADEVIE